MDTVIRRMSTFRLVISMAVVYILAILCCALIVWLELSGLAIFNVSVGYKYFAAGGVLLVASILEHIVVEQRLYMVTHVAFGVAAILGFVLGIAPICEVAQPTGIGSYVLGMLIMVVMHVMLIALLILMDVLVASCELKIGG